MRNMDPKKREEIFKKLVDDIRKTHGGGVAFIGDDDTVVDIDVISTGILSLDIALGVGGFPRGRIIEIFGDESSGKTSLALMVIASAQSLGGKCAIIDMEHAIDRTWSKTLGVELDSIIISQPDSGDQALEILEQMILTQALDVVVVDSVAALVTRAELEGSISDSHIGLQARMMSAWLRRCTPIINKSGTMVIFTNQTREKINMGYSFGPKKTTPGGRALSFYDTMRIETKYIGTEKEGTDKIGSRIRATVKKNKVAPPYKEAEFVIIYDEGISKEMDLLDLAIQNDLIIKSGAWYKGANGDTIGHGTNNANKFLKENAQYTLDLEIRLREIYGLPLPEVIIEDL